jgi:hypothetical protein
MKINGTHLIVCRNPKALEYLKNELCLLGFASEKGRPVLQGDALLARNELQEAGFIFGKDFYLKVIEN